MITRLDLKNQLITASSVGLELDDVLLKYTNQTLNWLDDLEAVKRYIRNLRDCIDLVEEIVENLQGFDLNLRRAIALPLADYIDECENYYEGSSEFGKPFIPLDHCMLPTSNESEESEESEESKGNNAPPCWVYFLESETTRFVKIGITNNLNRRINALISACGESIKVNTTLQCSNRENARKIEGYLHSRYSEHRMHPNGKATEWFENSISEDVISIFALGENVLLKMAKQ